MRRARSSRDLQPEVEGEVGVEALRVHGDEEVVVGDLEVGDDPEEVLRVLYVGRVRLRRAS